MLRAARATPSPVLALPCGSRSMTRIRCLAAASAVARLTAVVVLPTPPFWLATAMMRARRGASRAVSSATAASLMASHPPQTQNDPPPVGTTFMECRVHCPGLLGRGQFLPRPFALWEKTHRIGSDKRLRQNKQPVERLAAARGHDIDDMGRYRFDSRIADDDRRGGDACRFAQKGAFARIGLDQLDPRHTRYRQHQTGKTGAAA